MSTIEQLFQKITHDNVRSIVPLTDGFSNASYLVNGEKVFRIKNISDAPFYSAQSEGKILALVAPSGIAPKLDYFDFESGNLINHYFAGDHRFISSEITKEDLQALAAILKRLHAIEGCPSEFDPFQRYASYQSRSGMVLYPEEEGKISEIIGDFYRSEALVLCHNDLVQGNIIKSREGQIVLIDYEMAGLNNAFFDLASLLSENKIFAAEKIASFLKAYFGDAYTPFHLKKTRLWMAFENYLWFYWAVCRYKETGRQCFNEIAKDKKNAIDLFSGIFRNNPDFWKS